MMNCDLPQYLLRQLTITSPMKCLQFARPLEVYAELRSHSLLALGT